MELTEGNWLVSVLPDGSTRAWFVRFDGVAWNLSELFAQLNTAAAYGQTPFFGEVSST